MTGSDVCSSDLPFCLQWQVKKKMAPKVAASYQFDDQYFAVIDSVNGFS